MIDSTDLMRSYLHVVARSTHASAATLYVPAASAGPARGQWAHIGDDRPPTELASLEASAAFAHRVLMGDPGVRAEPNIRLIPLPLGRAIETGDSVPAAGGRRRVDQSGVRTERVAWLALRLPAEGDLGSAALGSAWWPALLSHGAALAGHLSRAIAFLTDPVTGVPGRVAFQELLASQLDAARGQRQPVALLFTNPDDFDQVNAQFGREFGDQVVREVMERLRGCLRRSDTVARYGGVIYATLLPDTSTATGRGVAEKVLRCLTDSAYARDSLWLRFSLGLAAFEPNEDDAAFTPVDLIRRADHALAAAKKAGGGRLVVWEPGSAAASADQLDELTGIFTGNATRDYRNMVLLWHSVSVMAASQDAGALCAQVAERLYHAFRPERVWLFGPGLEAPRLLAGLARESGEGSPPRLLDIIEISEEAWSFVRDAAAARRVCVGAIRVQSPAPSHLIVAPLVWQDMLVGGVALERPEPSDSADLLFLQALGTQVAAGLERVRLADEDRTRRESEQRRLRAELKDLRSALQKAKLEYRSPQMEALLAVVRRVAPTEATVLVIGESGTGKELLARTIHELSPRRLKPLVVVDCSAIAPTLIDSELFGRERGAYTGASERALGRLAEADGGTLLLDEIGELPLEVQSRLLRFVQEKQVTAVGGTRSRTVDVRIVAATNRDLEREVAAGRFRADLFHRLNVVRLTLPPLRARRDDVLHLARHFVETYAALYHKPVHGLTAEAEVLLLEHDWPGNIRELQNRIMQALILCGGEVIGPEDLGLRAVSGPREEPHDMSTLVVTPEVAAAIPAATPRRSVAQPAAGVLDRAWTDLAGALGAQVDEALATGAPRARPLGRWLTADLVLAASEAAQRVSRRAAQKLGIPDTTFRRLLQKAEDARAAGASARAPGWERVVLALRDVVADGSGSQDRVDRAERVLIAEIVRRLPEAGAVGAALLGVTLETYRRRLAALPSTT